MRKEKRMRFKVNMNKASQGIHLLSHNVAATMGLIKPMEEIGASEQICEGRLKSNPSGSHSESVHFLTV